MICKSDQMPQGTMDRLVLPEFPTLELLPYLLKIALHHPLHFAKGRGCVLYPPAMVDKVILPMVHYKYLNCCHMYL